ncbi:hypothetical protein [Oleiagrimonas soli]|uniref:Lipoprotein n=1 Tax=Oleiagrimonas soli TaxID=1543381 RepID=A0A099CWR8_9GAMM|nr:hypothetical protein [Oleiagrimonas soli]KGI78194.1 hypothetical protein LF63_0107605 [Oleiagrimonas soli]MBB6183349.1 hypothetical protein [Oleiagrimonas soli]
MRHIASIAVALLLTACSTLYPVSPNLADPTQVPTNMHAGPAITTVKQARELVFNAQAILQNASANKKTAQTVIQEIIFYGTFVAVFGVIHDSVAARNTGAGLAALGSALSGHYQLSDQKVAFQQAASALQCIKLAISPIDPDVREAFDGEFKPIGRTDTETDDEKSAREGLMNAYMNVPDATIHAIQSVNTHLVAALNGITLPTPGNDEISRIVEAYGKTKTRSDTTAEQLTAPAEDGEKARLALAGNTRLSGYTDNELADAKRKFIKATLQYQDQINLCLSTNQH